MYLRSTFGEKGGGKEFTSIERIATNLIIITTSIKDLVRLLVKGSEKELQLSLNESMLKSMLTIEKRNERCYMKRIDYLLK